MRRERRVPRSLMKLQCYYVISWVLSSCGKQYILNMEAEKHTKQTNTWTAIEPITRFPVNTFPRLNKQESSWASSSCILFQMVKHKPFGREEISTSGQTRTNFTPTKKSVLLNTDPSPPLFSSNSNADHLHYSNKVRSSCYEAFPRRHKRCAQLHILSLTRPSTIYSYSWSNAATVKRQLFLLIFKDLFTPCIRYGRKANRTQASAQRRRSLPFTSQQYLPTPLANMNRALEL